MPEGHHASAVRLTTGAVVALVLVGALVVSWLGGDSRTTSPSTAITFDQSSRVATTTGSAAAGTVSTLSTAQPDPTDEAREAGAAALAAWGRFTMSGDLSVLNRVFHPDSPQSELLAEKAADIAADPLADPTFVFEMANPSIEQSPGRVTMQGAVSATRGDGAPSFMHWRLVLVWSDASNSWLVWTLEEVP